MSSVVAILSEEASAPHKQKAKIKLNQNEQTDKWKVKVNE